jgi:protein dpy-30
MRSYLEAQIMPLLLEALSELVKSKPQDPVEFIANYMLEHNPEKR